MQIFKFESGARVKDEVSGYIGIIIGRTEWLNGCCRYGVQGQRIKEDGTLAEAQWFDEERLTLEKKGHRTDLAFTKEEYPKGAKQRTGGPHPAPEMTPPQG